MYTIVSLIKKIIGSSKDIKNRFSEDSSSPQMVNNKYLIIYQKIKSIKHLFGLYLLGGVNQVQQIFTNLPRTNKARCFKFYLKKSL